jgi:hypothetical protein
MQKYIYFAEEVIGGVFNVLQMDHIDRMNVGSLQTQGKFWHCIELISINRMLLMYGKRI